MKADIIRMRIDKECKHSRRYGAEQESSIKTIYMDREDSNGNDWLVLIPITSESELSDQEVSGILDGVKVMLDFDSSKSI